MTVQVVIDDILEFYLCWFARFRLLGCSNIFLFAYTPWSSTWIKMLKWFRTIFFVFEREILAQIYDFH